MDGNNNQDKCYVCHPEMNEKFYLWTDHPDLVECYVNQNFKGLQELIIVPRKHIGEFRHYPSETKKKFWMEVSWIIKRLLKHNAQKLVMEISYGNWIVHQKGTAHYHAHIHLMFSPFSKVLASLAEEENFNLQVPPNMKPKVVYPGDVLVELKIFRPLSFFSFCEKYCQILQVFVMTSGWFKKLDGFVLQIRLISASGRCTYGIRTKKENNSILAKLINQTPRRIIEEFIREFPKCYGQNRNHKNEHKQHQRQSQISSSSSPFASSSPSSSSSSLSSSRSSSASVSSSAKAASQQGSPDSSSSESSDSDSSPLLKFEKVVPLSPPVIDLESREPRGRGNGRGKPPVRRFRGKKKCYDFIAGGCQRGDSCKDSHVDNSWGKKSAGRDNKRGSSKPCFDFQKGDCRRGDICFYSHEIKKCYAFERGDCQRESCNYSHDASKKHKSDHNY